MRLPLRHPPPGTAGPPRRCAFLEALVEEAVGLPLGPAASLLSSRKSRGRHGNALQWHLGLESHDGDAVLDWEDRIEIKLVSVWQRAGRVVCDKLKVCDIGVDPWHKLSNVLWVFADRMTRIVVGAAQTHLHGEMANRLAAAWQQDPHFDHPPLFVEARETEGKSAPAYYLAARWFEDEQILPSATLDIFPFDSNWWSAARRKHRRDPWITVVDGRDDVVACPRCGGPLRIDPARVATDGWSPAQHGMPGDGECLMRSHLVVQGARLRGHRGLGPEALRASIEQRVTAGELWRLAHHVAEPDDHLHDR